MSERVVALVYHGGGYGGALLGVPARDLSPDEVRVLGGTKMLLRSGLYAKANGAPEIQGEQPEQTEPEQGGDA